MIMHVLDLTVGGAGFRFSLAYRLGCGKEKKNVTDNVFWGGVV